MKLPDARRSPALMLDVLTDGRVLVDRDERWWPLVAGERRWRRLAAQEGSLEDPLPDLEL